MQDIDSIRRAEVKSFSIANSIGGIGRAQDDRGDYAEARKAYEESVTVWANAEMTRPSRRPKRSKRSHQERMREQQLEEKGGA